VVLGNTGNDPRLAGAADAELAGIIDVDASLVQHFEDLLALGDVIFLAGTRELDPEAADRRRLILLGREIFDMDVAFRPAGGAKIEQDVEVAKAALAVLSL
jgi:hypothetical protein